MLVQCVSTSHQAPPEALATSYLAGIDVGHNRWGRAMREAQRLQGEARVAADLVRKQAVLRLTEEGHSVRTIAVMLGLSKSRVARIVRTGSHIIVAIKTVSTTSTRSHTTCEKWWSESGGCGRGTASVCWQDP